MKNNNLYNDKEIDDEGDLNWEDYGFRNYDPQIGRFVQIDPLTDDYPALSSYHYALNDPITNIDEDGLSGLSVVQQVACWTGQTVGSVKLMGTVNEITHIIAVSSGIAKIGLDIGNSVSATDEMNSLLSGPGPKQVGPPSNIGRPTGLDGVQASKSSEEVDKKLRLKQYLHLRKTSWKKTGPISEENTYTGERRTHSESLGDDLVGQAAMAYVMWKIPLPKFGKASGLFGVGVKAAVNNEKSIVIGEGMDRVKEVAKSIGAKWYQAWSKNFPEGRLMTEKELGNALKRNARWIKEKINEGYKIYDIGIDPTKGTRSPFYELEKKILQELNYPVIKL